MRGWGGLRRGSSVFLFRLAADVRPEFFDHQGEGVIPNLGPPYGSDISQIAIGTGMVAVGGNRRRDGAAENLRKIELTVAGIGGADKDPAHSMTGPTPEASCAHLVITGVLAEDGRKDCADHEIFDNAVGGVGSEAFAVTFGSLSVAGFAVGCLTDPGLDCVPRNLDGVESAAGDHFEFLPSRKRWHVLGFDSQEVGQGKEQAVVRGAGVFLLLEVGIFGALIFRRRLRRRWTGGLCRLAGFGGRRRRGCR